MRGLFLLLALILSVTANTQIIRIKTSIYFDTDSFLLAKEHYPTLDKFADTAKKLIIKGILLHGNTDADADSLYNIRLSEKRASSVKQYLIQEGIPDSLIQVDYNGENKPITDNTTGKGKQKNRRVDIILIAKIYISFEDPPRDIIDSCNHDTTFIFNNGMKVTMGICDFIRRKNCLEFNNNPAFFSGLIDSFLTANASNKLLLSSLLNINYCKDSCFEKPIKIEYHIDNECEYLSLKELRIYYRTPNGNWEAKYTKAKKIHRNKQLYYQFEVSCPGLFTLLFCGGTCGSTPQLKVKGKYKIAKVEYANNCNQYKGVYTFDPPQKKIKLMKEVLASSTVYITIVNKKGDTLRYGYYGNNHNPFINKPKLKFHFFKRCDCCIRKYPFISLNYNEKIIIRKRFIKRYFIRDDEF